MKIRLRIIIGLLFSSTLVVAQVQRVDSASVRVDSIWGCPGEEIEVPVRVHGISQLGLNAFTFYFNIDTAILEPILLNWDTVRKMGTPLFSGWDDEFMARGIYAMNYFWGSGLHATSLAITWIDRDPRGETLKREDGSVLIKLNFRIKQMPAVPSEIKLTACNMAYDGARNKSYPIQFDGTSGHILAKSNPVVKIEGKQPKLDVNSPDIRICRSPYGVIETLPLKATGAERYEWINIPRVNGDDYYGPIEDVLDRADVADPVLRPIKGGMGSYHEMRSNYNFLLKGYNSDGCVGVDSVRIFGAPNMDILISPTTAYHFVNKGETIDLKLLYRTDNRIEPDEDGYQYLFSPYTYFWFPYDKVENPNVAETKTRPINEPVWFWGQGVDKNGCAKTINIKVDVREDTLFGYIDKSAEEFCSEADTVVTLAALVEGGSDSKTFEWEYRKLYDGKEPYFTGSRGGSSTSNAAAFVDLVFFGTTEVSVRITDQGSLKGELVLRDTVFAQAMASLSVHVEMDEASQRQAERGYCTGTPIALKATVTNGGSDAKIYWEVNGYRIKDDHDQDVEGETMAFTTRNGYTYRAVAYSSARCLDKKYAFSNVVDPKVEAYQVTSVWLNNVSVPEAGSCNTDSVELNIHAHNLGIDPVFQIFRNDELVDEFIYGDNNPDFMRKVKSVNYWDRFRVRFTNTSCNCLINNNEFSNYVTAELHTTPKLSVAKIVSDMGGDTICNSNTGVYTFRLTGMEQVGQNTTVIWMLNDKEWGRYEFDETVSAALANAPEQHNGNFVINTGLEQDEFMSFRDRYAFYINAANFPEVGQDFEEGDSLWAIVISSAKCGGSTVIDTVPAVKPQFLELKEATLTVTPENGLSVCKGDSLVFNAKAENAGYATINWYWNNEKVASGTSYTMNKPWNGDSLAVVLESNYKCTTNDLPLRKSFQITVNNPPELIVQKDTTICNGTSIQLAVQTTATKFVWNDDPTLSSMTVKQPEVTPAPNQVHTYTVTVTDDNECQSTDTLIVRTAKDTMLTALLELTYPGDTLICKGQRMVQMRALVLPSRENPTHFRWFKNGYWTTDAVALLNKSDLRDGDVYQVEITNPDFQTCRSKTVVSNAVRFTVKPNIKAVISAQDNKICNNDSLMLIALGGTKYRWTSADLLVDGRTDESLYVKPDVTTKYYLQAFDDHEACSSKDSITITVDKFVDIRNDLELTNRTEPAYCSNADSLFVFKAKPFNGGEMPLFDWYVNGEKKEQTTAPACTFQLREGDKIYCEMHASEDIVTCGSQFAVSPTVTIIKHPAPTGGAAGDTVLCPGESTTLTAIGGIHYLWTPGKDLSSDKEADITAAPGKTTTYAVRISNEYDCFITDTVKVEVLAAPKALTLSIDPEKDSLCVGQTMTLNLEASYTEPVHWFINGQEQSESGTTLIYAPADGDQVYASMKVDHEICLEENEKQSNVFTPRMFTVYAEMPKKQDTICVHDTLNVTVNTNGTAFKWFPVNSMHSYTAASVKLYPRQDLWYSISASIGNCIATDTLYLAVVARPNEPTVDNQAICEESLAELTVSNPKFGETYLWYAPDDLTAPIHTGTVLSNCEEGYYAVRAVGANGCLSRSHKIVQVIPGVRPEASVRVLTGEVLAKEAIRFANNSKRWARAFWNFGDSRSDEENNSQTVEHTFSNVAAYPVILTVESADGCLDSAMLKLTVLPQLNGVYVPSAFIPGSSHPEDCVLKVYGEDIASFRFVVYSLTGQELFVTENFSQGWDGRYQGKDMPTGNYSYLVVAKLTSGQEVTKSGTATLIR